MELGALKNVPYFMDAFSKWTMEMPNMPMLVDDKHYEGWTRARVDEYTGKVYGYLKRNGIGREDFVLINLPRGVFPVIAMIGVWKAGAAFVVVEDTYAPERIAFIQADCGCKMVLDLDTMVTIGREEEYLPGYERADDHDAAFAVYTSGSTGRPKGVLHEYGNIKLDALVANLQVEPGMRGALIAPLNFVVSIKALLAVLYAPCTFFIVPYATVKNPRKLLSYFFDNKIDLTYLSPSIIRATGGDLGPYIKLVHTGSEPANGVCLTSARLVNNYSMSEAAFTVCQFVVDKPYDECPVGKPNSPIIQIRLIDEDGNDVPDGEMGEIIFENPFMRGYINLPVETAKAMRDGWYHTGDLGRKDESGNLILVGRANDMIKINGNRIEPAEIEAAFKQVTGKDWCAAKGFEDPGQSYVCAYYVGPLEQSEAEVRTAMEQYLPYYMIPAYFVQVEDVPLLPNGKLDRKVLPDPRKVVERGEYVAPRDEFETNLCKAFEEALGIEHVGITEDFYSLGGSSVSAMQVLGIMQLDTLSAVDIFQGRTVEGIAEIYREKSEIEEGVSEEEKEMEARKHPHEVPAVQVNIIDTQLFSPKAPMWIFPFLLSLGPDADPELVLSAARKVVEHHPIFATVFEFNDQLELQQRYDPSVLEEVELEVMTDEEFEELRASQIETFKVLGEPMVKMRVFKTDSNVYVMIIFHHIVMDGSSVQIMFANLLRALTGMDMELDTYYSYLEDEERLRTLSSYRRAFHYYQENYEGIDWCRNIERDKDVPGNVNGTRVIETCLTPENLAAMEQSCGISPNGFVNAIVLIALARMTGKRDIMTMFTFHNRADERKQHACGLLARSLPLGMRIDQYETLADFYEGLREQSAGGIANSSFDWAIEAQRAPYIDDIFPVVYETAAITDTSALDMIGAKMEPLDAHNEAALRLTMLQVFETPTDISVLLSYMTNAYSEERIDEFAREFAGLAEKMIDIKNPRAVKVSELLA